MYRVEQDEDKEEEVKKAQCEHPPPFDNDDVIGFNECLCLPKAEFSTRFTRKKMTRLTYKTVWSMR